MRVTDFLRGVDPSTLDDLRAALFRQKGSLLTCEKWLLKSIGRGRKVLDLGCATGFVASQIKRRNNDVYGVDINAAACARAKADGILVKQADLNDGIPFESRSFDVVLGGHIFEYVYDSRRLVEECARVLRPGGMLLISVNNLNSLQNRFRVMAGGYLNSLGAYPEDHGGGQVRLWNLPKLKELLAIGAFELFEVKGTADSAAKHAPRTLAGGVSQALTGLASRAPSMSPILLVKARKPLRS
jgi:SAM-dependent methyltransferase